ncbi:anti-sigma factor [Flavobacterium paronense]|uniref:Anti-sigma factor n=1 Tax=Flavobacterium paronense TaxID=1392775 RepID=A0ABV5GHB1_9FLAO|nr:anti-sigma factor [Flavobacterium paronense]MDN3677047.1 anti-sigma factor [Flavobacterium paronense]
MSTTELLNSGDLELYVFGILNESETNQIAELSIKDKDIKKEIISIEHSVLALSSSFSPIISSDVYEKIKYNLGLKKRKVIKMKPKNNKSQYIGWAASVALLVGIGFQYSKLNVTKNQIKTIEVQKSKLEESVVDLELKNKETQTILGVVRDETNTVVSLGGQAAAPTAKAKIYWNKQTQVVYVDASGLPKPPEGKVYQIWSLKLQPQLTPTSIGLLSNFQANESKIFAVDKTSGAEAFGITLEPAGGSKSPTMEQLYTLGKV